jgi:Holliday junction resolvase RusA-like endonuclease
MSTAKRYRLCKDLPDLKAGAIGIVKNENLVFSETENSAEYYFDEKSVKDNQTWFEPIPNEEAKQEVGSNSHIPVAIKTLCDALKNDEGYYIGWQSNIAMAFYDEWELWSKEKVGRNSTYDCRHEIANAAAERFLKQLISETPSRPTPEYSSKEWRIESINHNGSIYKRFSEGLYRLPSEPPTSPKQLPPTNYSTYTYKALLESRIIFPITPQTNVILTQNTYKIFNIPEVCPRGKKGCKEYRQTNYCPHTLNERGRYMKRRLAKMNDYKATILGLARSAGFALPAYGWAVYFYFPIPKKWKQEERVKMHGQPHFRKPDFDNCYKLLVDALVFQDEQVAQISGGGKFWVNTKQGTRRQDPCGQGWIEILIDQPVYNPFNVTFIDQSKIISLRQTMDYKKQIKDGTRVVKKRTPKKVDNFKRKTDELK